MGADLSQEQELVEDCMHDGKVSLGLVDTLTSRRFHTLANLLLDNRIALPPGTYTIFAPSDEAFSKIDTSKLSKEQIVNIIKYHVVPQRIVCYETAEGLAGCREESGSHMLPTLFGQRNLWLSKAPDGGPRVNTSAVDRAASNLFFNDGRVRGVINGIDGVLSPCGNTTNTISEALTNRLLLKLVTDLNLAGVLTEDGAMYTVFAPPDAALQEAFFKNGKLKVKQEDAVTALKGHVVAGCFTQATLLYMLQKGGRETVELETLSGKCLTIGMQGQKVVVLGEEIVEVQKEVQHSTGVVHDVAAVLSGSKCGPAAIKKRAARK